MEESHPTVKHVTVNDNDDVDALSRLDISDNSRFHEMEWGEATKPLTFPDKVKERIQMLFPMASEEYLQDKKSFLLLLICSGLIKRMIRNCRD